MRIIGKLSLSVKKNAKIILGDNVTLNSDTKFNPLCRGVFNSIYVMENAILRIGNGTGISSVCLWVKTSITIGNRVAIGAGCIMLDNDCHNLDYEVRSGLKLGANGKNDAESAKSSPITVGDDVLIGAIAYY